jgi:hypothetical protein
MLNATTRIPRAIVLVGALADPHAGCSVDSGAGKV